MPNRNEVYLGDGLYASHDGFQFWLRAPRIGGDHTVALDPDVVLTLLRYIGQTWNCDIQIEKKDGSSSGQ